MEPTKLNECKVQCDHSGCLNAPLKMLSTHKNEQCITRIKYINFSLEPTVVHISSKMPFLFGLLCGVRILSG